MALTLKGKDPNKNILNGIKKILNTDGSSNSSSLEDTVEADSKPSANSNADIQSKLATILPASTINELEKGTDENTIDKNTTKNKNNNDDSLLSEIKAAVKDVTTKAKQIKKDPQVKAVQKFVKSSEGKSELESIKNILQAAQSNNVTGLEANLTNLLSQDAAFSAKFKSALAFLNKKLCGNPSAGIASNSNASAAAAAVTASAAFSIFSCPIDKSKVTQMALKYVTDTGVKSLENFTANAVSDTKGATKVAAAISNAILTTTIKNNKLSASEVTKSLTSTSTIKTIVKKTLKETKKKKNTSKDILTYDKKTTTADKDTKKSIVDTGLALNKKSDIYTTKSTKIAPDSLNTNLIALAKKTIKENVPKSDSKPTTLDDSTKIAMAGSKANNNMLSFKQTSYVMFS